MHRWFNAKNRTVNAKIRKSQCTINRRGDTKIKSNAKNRTNLYNYYRIGKVVLTISFLRCKFLGMRLELLKSGNETIKCICYI